MSERARTYLCFFILTLCFMAVGYLEKQDNDLSMQMAAERQAVKVGKR